MIEEEKIEMNKLMPSNLILIPMAIALTISCKRNKDKDHIWRQSYKIDLASINQFVLISRWRSISI